MATTYHNAALNISQSTTSGMIYSASGDFLTAGSGETLILKSMQVCNASKGIGTTYYDQNIIASFLDASTGTTHSIANTVSVPKHSSIDVLSDNFVLESGDKIQLQITGSSEATLVYESHAIGSYLKIT
jgi:hypothetical protein